MAVSAIAPLAAAAALWAGAWPAPAADSAPNVQPALAPAPPAALGAKVSALLDGIPAENAAERDRISKELAGLGPEGIRAVCDMLAPPEQGGDAKPRMALHGLVLYAAGPGKTAERKMVSGGLLAATQLQSAAPAVKAFLIQQLRLVGGPESIEVVGRFLLDDTLCEPAAQTLVSIGGKAAAAEFEKSLPKAAGRNRVTIVEALGHFRDPRAVAALLADARSQDRDLRLTALRALANIGDPAASQSLEKAANAEAPYERAEATQFLLLFARRLAEGGHVDEAARICRNVIQTRSQSGERQAVAAALDALSKALGAKAVGDLASAMTSEDLQIRSVAAEIALSLPGKGVTSDFIAALSNDSPAVRAGILAMLGRRGDATALPAARAALKDADASVRVAAISATGALGKEGAIPDLLAALSGADEAQSGAVVAALIQIPGAKAGDTMAGALSTAAPEARVALLKALAGRNATAHLAQVLAQARGRDEAVRLAALDALGALADKAAVPALVELLGNAKSDAERQSGEKAILSTLRRINDASAALDPALKALASATEAPARCSFLRVLGTIGGEAALNAAAAAAKDASPEVKEAAVRSLADWPDASAAKALLEIARDDPAELHRVLALRGYVRLAGLPGKRPGKDTLKMYQDALEAARRAEDKKMVLAALGEMDNPKALDLALPCLADESLRAEADAAVRKMILSFVKSDLSAATTGMQKALEAAGPGGLSPELAGTAIEAAVAARGVFPQEAKAMVEKAIQPPAGEDLRRKGQAAVKLIDGQGDYVAAWQTAGPFSKPRTTGGKLLGTVFPPEESGGEGVRWRLLPLGPDEANPGLLDLARAIGGENRAAYLRTRIWVPKEQEAAMQVGHDDGARLWLNGERIHDKDAPIGLTPKGGETVEAPLREGWNDVMLKVVQGKGLWGAFLRVRTPDGGPIEGLRVDPYLEEERPDRGPSLEGQQAGRKQRRSQQPAGPRPARPKDKKGARVK